MEKVKAIGILNEEGVVKYLELNEEVIEGLYFIHDEGYISHNLKEFNITIEPAKQLNNMGIRYTKLDEITIITLDMWWEEIRLVVMFAVDDTVKHHDILDCEHPALEGLKPELLNALDLSKTVTLADLMKLEYFNR